MGVKLDRIPLSELLSLQQTLEMASIGMRDFLEKIYDAQEKGKVSLSYRDRLYKKIRIKVEVNNEWDDKMSKEIDRRLKSALGKGVTSPRILDQLVNEFKIEEDNHKKELDKRKEQMGDIQKSLDKEKGKTLDLNVRKSSEKKV